VEPSDITTTTNGDERPEAFSSGSERGYWKRLETVEVGLLAEREGWFLQKYKVESDVSPFSGWYGAWDTMDLWIWHLRIGRRQGLGFEGQRE